MSLDIYISNEHGETLAGGINITHNLRNMAIAAGLYDAMWQSCDAPAETLVPALVDGIIYMNRNKAELVEKYSPANGWGNWEGLVKAANDLLDLCLKNPDGLVQSCR